MSIRIQRLCRAQRLPIPILPRTVTRFTSSQPRPNNIHENPPPPANASASEPSAKDALEAGKAALKDKWLSKEKRSEVVHPALEEGYEIGGHLIQGKDAQDRHDEASRPKWGSWGVPLKLEGKAGTIVIDLPNFWLRDNCRCVTCVNQDTMQRAFDTFEIPSDILPEEVTTEKEGLKIKWAEGGHISIYPWEWILRHGTKSSGASFGDEKKKASPYKFWGREIQSEEPSVHYDEIMASDKGVAAWTAKIREYGFCYVDGCPVSPEKTQELLERIAFIRVTHYGGFYDFTADLTMKDTAYTNLALPAHTDNTYFTDPSGLQAFHLLSHTEGSGGESLLVDGFYAASILEKENPKAFNILAKFPIPWHASGNEGITITPSNDFPVFGFRNVKEGEKPELMQVRWNNDDRGVVGLKGDQGSTADDWYDAARLWSDILRRKELEYWKQLKPGRPLMFDNWRVLHGRAAFTGKRRICGAYINRDDYISRWRNTNYTREEALSQIL